jgi:hypothetical protein
MLGFPFGTALLLVGIAVRKRYQPTGGLLNFIDHYPMLSPVAD